MCRRIASALLVFMTAANLTLSAFAHTATIPLTGENKYKSVRLTPDVYNNANHDLSDLRIVDSTGQAVPYFIHSEEAREEHTSKKYPMKLIDSYLKDEKFYFDYQLAEVSEDDIIANSIAFSTNDRDFAKEVELYGSYDGLHWELVEHGSLYSVGGHEDLEIEFSSPQKFTQYRLRLSNNLEQIAFEDVELIYSEMRIDEISFIETMRPDFSVETDERQTRIDIAGLKNLRLCDITIETETMFQREVTTSGGIHKELYHLEFDGASYADTTIPLNRLSPTRESYALAVSNGDDRPIEVTGISVRYYADELIFEGKPGETYKLEFGADPEKTAPVYDITRYSEEILRGEIDRLTFGEIAYDKPAEEPPPQLNYSLVFNVVIVVVSLLMGGVFLTKLRKDK